LDSLGTLTSVKWFLTDILVAVVDLLLFTTRLLMTLRRPGRKWTGKSWMGSRSVLISPSPSDLTPQHRGCTWDDQVVTSAVEDVVVIVVDIEVVEEVIVTLDPAMTDTEEVVTDTEMTDVTGDMIDMMTEIVTDIMMTGTGMRGEMTETGIMTEEEVPVMEDIPRTEDTTPIHLLLHLDMARDLAQGLQVHMREIPDQEGNTDLEAVNMTEDIEN